MPTSILITMCPPPLYQLHQRHHRIRYVVGGIITTIATQKNWTVLLAPQSQPVLVTRGISHQFRDQNKTIKIHSSGWNRLVQSGQFCIGASNASPCFHDGGVPAISSNRVYGVYTFPDLQSNGKTYPTSTACNQSNKPGVFIQVKDYVAWIESNMKF